MGSSTVSDIFTVFYGRGPYTAGGTYQYVASCTNNCGTFTDSALTIVPSPTLEWCFAIDCVLSPRKVIVVTVQLKGARGLHQFGGRWCMPGMPVSVTVTGGASGTLTETYTGNLPQLGKGYPLSRYGGYR
ncbi:MAG: hypothetical protein U5L96_02945 [Owenweeksia sp.]|nr:hypothetical protein [Owenweeksia sp.]